MIKKLKIITIVGTRPEIIRLSRIISKLDDHFDHILVHTGQNYDYELSEVFFNDLNIRKPNFFLNAARNSPAETIAEIIKLSDKVLVDNNPDAILILGDTNSSLASISAKRRKIPIFHMEAGNRCFDFRVPEEINRRIVDHISDINLPYSHIAREYLIKEGIPSDQIIVTGSPMREVLNYQQNKINSSKILIDLKLDQEKYFLVSFHREENVDSDIKLTNFLSLLTNIIGAYDLPIIVSTHPRTRNRIKNLNIKVNPKIQFHKPFSFSDYINLQLFSKVTLSDSGTITEESSILNFPALNLREVHERPEGMEEGSVMFVGLNSNLVLNALDILNKQPRNKNRLLQIVQDYSSNNVSDKIVRIILSYTDFVNRKIWKKASLNN